MRGRKQHPDNRIVRCDKYRKREIPVRGRKPYMESMKAYQKTYIEKEKSPWGDENSSSGILRTFRISHRKREIPVRGRKHYFFFWSAIWPIDRKREIPVRGRKLLHRVRFIVSDALIEKEKSPWGDENALCSGVISWRENHRKREIPVRGRKHQCRVIMDVDTS